MNNFHYGQILLDMLYGIEVDNEDYEELALLAWKHIGNKNTKLYRYCALINSKDLSVTLPCSTLYESNSDDRVIEAVTASYEDWDYVTNRSDHGDFDSAFVEHSIEAEKFYLSKYYLPGKLLKYEKVGNKLYFTHNYGKINILYKGTSLDDEGLPEITDKEALAIATYVAYILKYKEGLVTNNANIINLASSLLAQWLKLCDLARVSYLNQNDMNNILDVKSSWDRHSYGKSTKPIK